MAMGALLATHPTPLFAGLQDNASEVSAFTLGGSASRIAQLPPGGDAAADCHAGDMYDPVAAASMAAAYAAEHVKALSGGAVITPGLWQIVLQPKQTRRANPDLAERAHLLRLNTPRQFLLH